MKQAEIYKLAIEKWGVGMQVAKLIEGMSGLTISLSRVFRVGDAIARKDVSEEIADIEIMLGHMRLAFFELEKHVQRWKRIKKRRLLKDIKQTQNELNFEEKK